jgi:prephenate dehydrogenase
MLASAAATMSAAMAKTIGILGLGRFGRMTYEYLVDRHPRVWTRDASKLEGLAGAASFEEAAASDVVVLTVPISAMQETCGRLAPLLRPGQIVVDTCSVKVEPVRLMTSLLPAGVAILGTHPLFGPDSGKDGIAGLKIVLSPVRMDPASYQRIRGFLGSLGLLVIEATPEEHDRQAARTQAVFHLLAQALGRLGWGDDPIATPAPEAFFRHVRSLRNDSRQLFLDMQRRNPFAAEYRRLFVEELRRLDSELAE